MLTKRFETVRHPAQARISLISAAVSLLLLQAGAAGAATAASYDDMPEIAPIGVRIAHYLPVPQQARGPPSIPQRVTGWRSWEMVFT